MQTRFRASASESLMAALIDKCIAQRPKRGSYTASIPNVIRYGLSQIAGSAGRTNAWTAAWQAPYYYKGTNDTRLSIYDALSTGATSNPYTYAEWLEDQNEELTAIRTVKPEYISQFVEVYKEYVNS